MFALQLSEKMMRKIPGVKMLHLDKSATLLVRRFDPLKICLQIADPQISGHELYDTLENNYGIVPEFATDKVESIIEA